MASRWNGNDPARRAQSPCPQSLPESLVHSMFTELGTRLLLMAGLPRSDRVSSANPNAKCREHTPGTGDQDCRCVHTQANQRVALLIIGSEGSVDRCLARRKERRSLDYHWDRQPTALGKWRRGTAQSHRRSPAGSDPQLLSEDVGDLRIGELRRARAQSHGAEPLLELCRKRIISGASGCCWRSALASAALA